MAMTCNYPLISRHSSYISLTDIRQGYQANLEEKNIYFSIACHVNCKSVLLFHGIVKTRDRRKEKKNGHRSSYIYIIGVMHGHRIYIKQKKRQKSGERVVGVVLHLYEVVAKEVIF
ncbi:hypothetical protein FRX31_007852 [Thalictrum thalictroides]|uniref:Uncharacterized protein n=1 Tax=Thalictrum thalictroides TaxID=46969 RepID=A0A7J6WYP1_THATH|nr:hypothetical protein FRX31_007852 [Thalictrum thalictroides]